MAFNISAGLLNCAVVFFLYFQREDARSELSSLASSFWEVGVCFLGLGFVIFFTSCFSEPLVGSADHSNHGSNHGFVSQFGYVKVDSSSTVV